MDKPKRKRILVGRNRVPASEDGAAFGLNKSSPRARKIATTGYSLTAETWIDQHYQIRKQLGDTDGFRTGIEQTAVESLVRRSMNHLFTYSTLLKTFHFINDENQGVYVSRVVLQERMDDRFLNVVIEAHYLEVSMFEITIKTAMCTEEFRIADGQFVLQVDGNQSTLKRMERGTLREIHHL